MAEEQRGRRGRRSGRPRGQGRNLAAEQPAFAQPRMRFAPIAAVSDDELEAIHEASLIVLKDTGIEFLLDDYRWKEEFLEKNRDVLGGPGSR